MFAVVNTQYFYRQLLTINFTTADPSDVLNLVDEARREMPALDSEAAERIEAKCRSVELDIHLMYTPPSLALACCE